ncbi:LolA family protein, partial [Bacteroides fragilis]
LNPYALLQIYRHGFDYKIGSLKNFGGKPVYEVVLTATDKKRDLSRIVLYVSKETYQPLFIMMEQRDKSRSEITVTGYQTGLKYADGMFVFDKKQYPHAEVIDLR